MKQKLLIVVHHLTIGGVQKSLISALKAIDYSKYDVTLYLRKNRTNLLPYVDERVNVIINTDPTHYYRKPYSLILQFASYFFRLFGKIAKAEKYDTLLADKIRKASMEYEQNTYFKDKVFDKAIAYVQGYTVQFVDEYVNATEKYMFFHTSTDEIHSVHTKAIPRFKKIAALHQQQKELIEMWYPEAKDKISIVENYADRDFLLTQSKEYSVSKSEDKICICSCGRFAAVKGFDMAVESAKLLKDKNISFLWYFVGDGPERKKIEGLIEKYNLLNNIVITGMQTNPYPYMAACDIYIQPSYQEAMPVTILEALRLNKPVITTATVGGEKLVKNGKNGLVCEINAKSLAEAVEYLIKDKNTYTSIVNNLENTDYSKESEKYKEQWKSLLEE